MRWCLSGASRLSSLLAALVRQERRTAARRKSIKPSVGCARMVEFPKGSRLYVDTNIWIYYIEANASFVQKVHDLFVSVEATASTLVTNEITVAECLYKPFTDDNLAAVQAYDRLFGSGEIALVPLDGPLARQAALHGGKLGLKLIDAIHYVSALTSGCDHFITSDVRFRSCPILRVMTIQA